MRRKLLLYHRDLELRPILPRVMHGVVRDYATIVGLVFGTIMAVIARIWMLRVRPDRLAMIYWDLESRVAHLVFK